MQKSDRGSARDLELPSVDATVSMYSREIVRILLHPTVRKLYMQYTLCVRLSFEANVNLRT